MEGVVGFSEVETRTAGGGVDVDGYHNDLFVETLSMGRFTAKEAEASPVPSGFGREIPAEVAKFTYFRDGRPHYGNFFLKNKSKAVDKACLYKGSRNQHVSFATGNFSDSNTLGEL